jgi:PAS domain-containing protein
VGRISLGTIPLVTRGGDRVPVETKIAPGQWGGKPALYVVARDVTERVRAEEALRRAHDELETRIAARTSELAEANAKLDVFRRLVEAAERGAARIDLDGLVRWMNPSFARALGEERAADVEGVPLVDYCDAECGRRLRREIFPEALAKGRWRGEFTFRPRGAPVLAIPATLALLRDDDAQPICFSLIADLNTDPNTVP